MKLAYVYRFGAAALLALGLSSCGTDNTATVRTADNALHDAEVNVTEADVLKRLNLSNQFEIDLANQVLARGEDQAIKDLAQRLVTDHQESQQQIQDLAGRLEIALNEDFAGVEAMRSEQDAIRTRLIDQSGARLEQAWLKEMSEMHAKDIAFLSRAKEVLAGSETANYLETLLPTLQAHKAEIDALLVGETEEGRITTGPFKREQGKLTEQKQEELKLQEDNKQQELKQQELKQGEEKQQAIGQTRVKQETEKQTGQKQEDKMPGDTKLVDQKAVDQKRIDQRAIDPKEVDQKVEIPKQEVQKRIEQKLESQKRIEQKAVEQKVQRKLPGKRQG